MVMPDEKKRVLLVDDHPKVLRFIELRLKLDGFEIATAASGREALDIVSTNSFDVMLLDMRMPDMGGFEVLRCLRKFTQLPVIAYSATPEFSARAVECGADAFIAKPFNLDTLVIKIWELTNQRQ